VRENPIGFAPLYVMTAARLMSLIFFVSEFMDLLFTGEDQSQADQPNNLAEGHPF